MIRGIAVAAACLGFAVAMGAGSAPARAQSDIGVILMHGKQAPPGAFADMVSQLRGRGHKAIAPPMPWARGQWENISITVEAVHAQLDGMVAQLRSQGARRIVVGGHSIGANIALSYAAARGNVSGVVMIAPGHAPAFSYRSMPDFRAAVDRAVALVQSGQGAQPFSGPDNNQGRTFTVSTTAAAYASWMAPQGLASMPAQAPRLAARIPVLMLIGSRDPAFATAQSTTFQPAAKNAYSKYVAIQGGDHLSALGAAGNYVGEWLQDLPAEGAAPAARPGGPQTISRTCQRFEGSWTSRGPSGTLVLVRTGQTWSMAGTGSPNMPSEPRPVQSVQRTGDRVEVVTGSGARLVLDESDRKLTGQLVTPTGNSARVDMNCVK
ncbi:MAG: alpha/beta hydrolase [Alphaproteobacteria bacterium]